MNRKPQRQHFARGFSKLRLFVMPIKLAFATLAFGLSASPSFSNTVWYKTITHPLSNGKLYTRCSFGSTTCAGEGSHLGVDLMAEANSEVLAMCDGVVTFNNTANLNVFLDKNQTWEVKNNVTWHARLVIKHNCGGPFQTIYGYYGHIQSDLKEDAIVYSGEPVGRVIDWRIAAGNNSHLHMGVGYFDVTGYANYGYGNSTANWIDFQEIVTRPAAKPVLRAPVGGASAGTNINFSWDSVTGASNYRIVISQDPNPLRNFDNRTRTCNGTPNGGSACWTNPIAINSTSFSNSFTADRTYYWVVRANNSDWSEIGTFNTNTTTTSAATKAEGILNCIENILPGYFPPSKKTQQWRQSDGSIAYLRSYSGWWGQYHQAVWNNGWYYNIGSSWEYFVSIDMMKISYCPSAW